MLVVGMGWQKLERRQRAARTNFLSCPAKRGRRTIRSLQQRAKAGGRGVKGEACVLLDAPSTTLRVVPLPRYAGADERLPGLFENHSAAVAGGNATVSTRDKSSLRDARWLCYFVVAGHKARERRLDVK